uniref:Major facilitator superfamily (MFS) profile domain-containing protein n=1 Tax=Bionectria ochroleuca TaxID=29856 RepID=A0A8H7NCP1_BIOOC
MARLDLLGKFKAKTVDQSAAAQDDAPKFEHVIWYKDPGLRKLYFYAGVLCIASATNGYDGSFFNAVQNFETWQSYFDRPSGSFLGLLVALYTIASLVSLPLAPFLADRFGRKPPIILGCCFMIAGAVMQGAATSIGIFTGGRILLGFGVSFTQLCSPTLLTEVCHPQHRGRLTTIYNCLWNVGALIVSWLSFGTNYISNDWSWRVPAILQAFPSVIQLMFIWWVPESPRFLIAHDKFDEALDIFAKYHGNGDRNHPTVQFEFREARDTIKMELQNKKTTSYLDFFRTPGNRYRLIILISIGFFSQWSGNAIISNYTNLLYEGVGIKSSTTKLGLSAGTTSIALIISVSMALLVDKIGRRPIFILATAGMFLTFVFWTLSSALYEERRAPGANHAMIFFIWLFNIFYSTAWVGLVIGYSLEILPYKLRAKGLFVVQACVQAALALNNYANPVAFEAFAGHNWKLYLIYTCWIGFELGFVYFLYVETKGPTLEELARVFDGDDAQVAELNLEQVEKEAEILAAHDEATPDQKRV